MCNTFQIRRTMKKQITDALMRLQAELRNRTTTVTIVELTAYILIAAIALFGNCIVLWAVYRNSRLISIPNYFIISLAVSDVLIAVLSTPLSSAVLVTGEWTFGYEACQFQGVVTHWLVCVSTLTLAFTAINRYFKIVRPSLYRKVVTEKTAKVIVMAAWGLALVDPVVIMAAGHKFQFHPGKFFCFQENELSPATLFLCGYLGLPVIVLLFCYLKVFHVWRGHNRRLQASNAHKMRVSRFLTEDMRVTKTLFLTVVAFFTCWTPILCIDITELARGGLTMPRELYAFYTCVVLASSSINPWIYGFMNTTFRNEYRSFSNYMCALETALNPILR